MGLRFRKSIKIAPGVKLNLNKKSTSVTFGTKGAHYTVNSSGRKTASVGIPGTGISYSQSSNSGKKRPSSVHTTGNSSYNTNPGGKKWYEKTGWIIFFLIFFFPVGLFLMWKSNWKMPAKIIISLIYAFIIISYIFSPKLEQVTLSADTEQIYDINSQIPIGITTVPSDYELQTSYFDVSGGTILEKDGQFLFFASVPGEYTIKVNIAGAKSNELTLSFEDKAAIVKAEAEKIAKQEAAAQQAEQERIAQEQAAAQQAEQERIAQEQAAASDKNEEMVWVSGSGNKYHSNPNCSNMKNPSQITLSEAQARGKEPCKKCY